MGLWEKIKGTFGRKSDDGVKMSLVTETGNGFYSWHGELYRSDIIRSCIRPYAKSIGKLVAKHIRSSADGLKVNPEPYLRFLLEEPNPIMTGQMLQEKLATQLRLNNNAFALIIRNQDGYPVQIYPIPATSVEAVYRGNELHLKFTLQNGSLFQFPYSDIIHLRRDFHSNDVFGDNPARAIMSLMEIVYTTDQGIVKAIQNSSVIKWLLKFKQVLRPEDIKKSTDEFVQNYLSIDANSGGAAAADAKYDIEQVKQESYVPNASLTKQVLQRIYSFFGTNEKIIMSSYNEDEWISYYEAEIEPDAIQITNEYTRKIFTRKERGFGNRIIFEAANIQYASMKTKLALVAMVDRGALTPNEWREVFNWAPVEGGDTPIRRLDTASVEGGDKNAEDSQHQRRDRG